MISAALFGPALACSGLGSIAGAGEVMSISEEIKLGHRLAARLAETLNPHDNALVQDYVRRLGAKLLSRVGEEMEGFEFAFMAVDGTDQIRAMSLPGGSIYIYTGLIMMAETEAELACVIGHEIAHVTQRHLPHRLATQGGLVELGDFIERRRKVFPYLIELASGEVGQSYLVSFTRNQETAADTVGLSYAINAGYNPARFIDFFDRLDRLVARDPEVLTAHPDPSERVQNILRFVESLESVPDYEGGEAFEQIQAILWGPNGRPEL